MVGATRLRLTTPLASAGCWSPRLALRRSNAFLEGGGRAWRQPHFRQAASRPSGTNERSRGLKPTVSAVE